MQKGFIRTAELYESKDAIAKHLKGPKIAENQKQNGEWRTGVKQVYECEVVGGFLTK